MPFADGWQVVHLTGVLHIDEVKEAIEGLSCSPLEAKALTEIVKEVYFPLLEEKSIETIIPVQIVAQAIDLNEPPGKPIKKISNRSI